MWCTVSCGVEVGESPFIHHIYHIYLSHLFKYHIEELTKDLCRPALTIAMSKVETINDVPKKVYYVFKKSKSDRQNFFLNIFQDIARKFRYFD